jgi:ferrochelatase
LVVAGTVQVGVLLLQLGSPEAATAPALRRYLAEFLADRRVIDLSPLVWRPILHGIVLRTRPRKSAALYRSVWTDDGSPLAVTTRAQAASLEQRLGDAVGTRIRVAVAMRYGRPSIASALAELLASGADRILAFPMYPQYAGATTGSSLQRLFEESAGRRVVPNLRVVPPYFDDGGYINALAAVARDACPDLREFDRVLFSFHGLPRRYAEAGDPYPAHCHETARLLTCALGLKSERAGVVFQSRFGREPWLEPYTDVTLRELGQTARRVAVMCPGFTADCLETLEEIAIRGREQFLEGGGSSFTAVPCLNDHPAWLDGMSSIALRELSGWL